MSTTAFPPPILALILIFPNADILDYAGPLEVVTHATHNPPNTDPAQRHQVFATKTIAHTTSKPISTGTGHLHVQADLSISSLLEGSAENGLRLEDFQVLIVPGGPPTVMREVSEQSRPEMQLVRRFAALPPADTGKERTILSVCTGAFVLGAAGLLAGLRVTTHHMALEELGRLCERVGAPVKEVVGGDGTRFVDSGVVDLKQGGRLRVITAGGVSSGLDAALHLLEVLKGSEVAGWAARVVEYERRQV